MSPVNPWNARITGFGSISPFGPVCGLIAPKALQPRTFFEDPVRGTRRAFMVEPFRPAEVVPGLKTRRLDRLSVWGLVAAHLALKDARIDLESEDRSRWGVVFGTGYGCQELTEAYFKTVAQYGYGKADPILFAETLDNSPASHIARILGLRGPNITLSCRGISGEAALIQGASLLRSGEADRIIVLAGDTLSRPLYEWYEAAGMLSDACLGGPCGAGGPATVGAGFVPGEGLAAVVLEPDDAFARRGAAGYGVLESGLMGSAAGVQPHSWGECSDLMEGLMRSALGPFRGEEVELVVAAANGSPHFDDQEERAIRRILGPRAEGRIIAPKSRIGEFDGSGVLRLVLALSADGARKPGAPGIRRLMLLLGAAAGGSRAALAFALPQNFM